MTEKAILLEIIEERFPNFNFTVFSIFQLLKDRKLLTKENEPSYLNALMEILLSIPIGDDEEI